MSINCQLIYFSKLGLPFGCLFLVLHLFGALRYRCVLGECPRSSSVQKSSLRQRQHTSVRIAESFARFLHCSAHSIFTLKMRWTRTQATIPCDDLFGDVPHGTIVVVAMPFEQVLLPNFIKKNEKWGIYIVCFLMYNYLKVIK